MTGDHSSPVLFGDHSHEPVPFTIARVHADFFEGRPVGQRVSLGGFHTKDECLRYNEIDAARGALGRFDGLQTIPIVKAASDIFAFEHVNTASSIMAEGKLILFNYFCYSDS